MKIICIGCNKRPEEISSIVMFAEMEGVTPDEFVLENEGTYNEANGHFLCDEDYIKAGEPSSPNGWVAP